ncbi:MAG: sulfopropanediol 3-dehydrogenase [Thermoanaerobacteraceae bacterium]|uniref:Histidinol dehydrogenase n=1 Tax=Biomaibacter acetigenes TaxID=2316383 RepID=A0A3G2R3U5_9FIRM|nr:histidinol dehydrogenase [Biomaibacter acetigenes]AYO30005.1 histidinol dehydrogenase [Biomaibacter acetigenes]MDK2879851.1 sulfopropanediol 3-dehydrogenase [Thermoanaerobacteraceae bacterium]RKL63196.1 histidinol dehydrogenase [Thermoanaerobacteraceae bacterium SP2]
MIKLKEPAITKDQRDKSIQQKVAEIIDKVKREGDKALREYNILFDGCDRENYIVTKEEIDKAFQEVSSDIINDLRFAAHNIEEFARRQKETIKSLEEKEIMPGVFLGHRTIPVRSCACYVPGGRYPLPSSALMSIIPAKVAGVKRVITCSPPAKDTKTINPFTLVAMSIAGADEIYVMGGVQAIAAFTYGTKTITPVEKIVGPGNQYVTEAKRQVSGEVGIDFLAGPSEVVVIADKTANPVNIAADLLAQSEHDPQARGILLCTDEAIGKAVIKQVEDFLFDLSTADIARQAWINNGQVTVFDTLEEAIDTANEIAPEHLELQVQSPDEVVPKLTNYGSLFIGEKAAEVFGDYVSGTNHILPTMRAARYTGGVWVGTFIKIATNQRLTDEGVKAIAPVASRLAHLEGLYAHKLAADVRLKNM